MIGDGGNVDAAVGVELGFGMKLNEIKAEGFGGELLGGSVGAVATTAKEIVATTK